MACGAPSRHSCSVLHLNLIKADGKIFNFHFNLLLDKISPFRGTFCFSTSLFAAEKLNLWGTSSQWCKLEEMLMESRGKLPFVYLAGSEMSHTTKMGKFHLSLPVSQQCSEQCSAPIFLPHFFYKYNDFQLSLTQILVWPREWKIAIALQFLKVQHFMECVVEPSFCEFLKDAVTKRWTLNQIKEINN